MITETTCAAIYLEGHVGHYQGKLGYGVLRYAPYEVACVIDSQKSGSTVRDELGIDRNCPIVTDVDAAQALGVNTLVLGLTPSGGRMPEAWKAPISRAIELGLSIVNGLHERMAPAWSNRLRKDQWIWDVRQEPEVIDIARGLSKTCPRRVLFVGTDMAVGKMTAALELDRAAKVRGRKSSFLATGQTGIVISGAGVALDAIRVDYASGAIEAELGRHNHSEVVFVEGQGAINHPASTSTLPLLRGSTPTDLILCHRATQTHLQGRPEIAIPPIAELVSLLQDVASCCGLFPRPKWPAISLNTALIRSDEEAQDAIEKLEAQTHVTVDDPVRFGAERLLDALGLYQKQGS